MSNDSKSAKYLELERKYDSAIALIKALVYTRGDTETVDPMLLADISYNRDKYQLITMQDLPENKIVLKVNKK